MFALRPHGFEVLNTWAAQAGHEVVVVVTRPGSMDAVFRGAQVAARVHPSARVLITPRVQDVAALLPELDVDLGIIFGYTRIPESVGGIPRHGTVNLHPSLLPDYRGPNPWRALYDGEPSLGATLHRIVDEYDAGPILAQSSGDLPVTMDPAAVNAAWEPVLRAVLDEGVPKAAADDPGRAQQGVSAKVGTAFSDAEEQVPWTLPARVVQARVAALLLAGRQPKGRIDGQDRPILRVRPASGPAGAISSGGRRATVAVADGVVEVEFGRLPYG